MTWAENEFSNVIKTMRGYFNEINNLEKRSPPREDSPSASTTSIESKNYFQQLIPTRNENQRLKPFGGDTHTFKMHKSNGIHSTKNHLRRSHSSNAGNSCVPDLFTKSSWLKPKNTSSIWGEDSYSDFPNKFEMPKTQCDIIEFPSPRSSYRDDAASTMSECSPLLPIHTSCLGGHENEVCQLDCISDCPSTSSLVANNCMKLNVNLDSLSICEDESGIPPRISKMNEFDKKKHKSSIKSLYNIKSCSTSDNKELNAVIQLAQNASSCLYPQKKASHRGVSGKLFHKKATHPKEDRKTFFEELRLQQGYQSTPDEQLTYNELVSKTNLPPDSISIQEILTERHFPENYARSRQHSSLSDSENLLSFCGNSNDTECIVTSRSDGTEVSHIDEQLKLLGQRCSQGNSAYRCKSYPCGISPIHTSKQLSQLDSNSQSVITTSSRSLPTSLVECNSRPCLFERQISTPLPNTSILSLSELDECGPPLPSKGGSRSNLSSDDLTLNHKSLGPMSKIPHSMRISLPSSNLSLHRTLSPISQDFTANITVANLSDFSKSVKNKNCPTILSGSSAPPIPFRTIPSTGSDKVPPLPPKNLAHHSFPHKHKCLGSYRPSSEESDNIEEISSGSESSNHTSSIDSEGLELYPETCVCKHSTAVEVTKNFPLQPCQVTTQNLATYDEELTREVNAPMPGRYETSDSLVYEYLGNPPLTLSQPEHVHDKVIVLKRHFAEVSTNDLECALIENNYDVQEAIMHLSFKSSNCEVPSRCNKEETSCLIVPHGRHFVPDPMEV